MFSFVEGLEAVEKVSDSGDTRRALVEVGFGFVCVGVLARRAESRLGWVHFMLLVAGRQPLEVELGHESFFRRREFAESGVVRFPVHPVEHAGVPLIIFLEPFEQVSGPRRLAEVGGVVAGDGRLLDSEFDFAGWDEKA